MGDEVVQDPALTGADTPPAGQGAATAPDDEGSKLVPPEEVEALRKQIEEAQSWRTEYERGKQELEDERRKLLTEKETVSDALAFRKALENDPELARAIQQAAAERLYGRRMQAPDEGADEAVQTDPRMVQALQVLAQHGQATEQQLKEIGGFVEEQKKQAEEWRAYRGQLEAAKLGHAVKTEATGLASKYVDRYEFAEVEDVVRYAVVNPEEAKKVGVAGLMRRSHEENKRVVEKHLQRKLEAAGKSKQNTLGVGGGGVASAPKPQLAGEARVNSMEAFLEKLNVS